MLERKLRDNTGGALVELALVLPLFVVIVLGAAEFGRLAYASIEVTNAARAGVAYGAQNHVTASDTTGIRVAATTDGPNVAPINVYAGPCVCPASSATTSFLACSTTNFFSHANSFTCPSSITTTTEYIQVNTSATVSTLVHVPGFPSSYTVNGSATMIVEQ
jgi:Flp pilus assembly protein TadG